MAWLVFCVSLYTVHAKEQQVDNHQDNLLKQAVKYRCARLLQMCKSRKACTSLLVLITICHVPYSGCGVSATDMCAIELLLSCCNLLARRDKPDATVRELKIAVGLLKEAAGLVGTRTNAAKGSKRIPVPGFPDLQFADNGLPAALRELAKCYQVTSLTHLQIFILGVDALAKRRPVTEQHTSA